jgi:hypothetical protein
MSTQLILTPKLLNNSEEMDKVISILSQGSISVHDIKYVYEMVDTLRLHDLKWIQAMVNDRMRLNSRLTQQLAKIPMIIVPFELNFWKFHELFQTGALTDNDSANHMDRVIDSLNKLWGDCAGRREEWVRANSEHRQNLLRRKATDLLHEISIISLKQPNSVLKTLRQSYNEVIDKNRLPLNHIKEQVEGFEGKQTLTIKDNKDDRKENITKLKSLNLPKTKGTHIFKKGDEVQQLFENDPSFDKLFSTGDWEVYRWVDVYEGGSRVLFASNHGGKSVTCSVVVFKPSESIDLNAVIDTGCDVCNFNTPTLIRDGYFHTVTYADGMERVVPAGRAFVKTEELKPELVDFQLGIMNMIGMNLIQKKRLFVNGDIMSLLDIV